MGAIYRRELKSYFVSPAAYVFIAVFYMFSGLFFYGTNLGIAVADIPTAIEGMFQIVLYLIPLITMRVLSEDKKNKTDQALITAPIGTMSIVLGKFFATFTIYLIACGIFLIYALLLAVYAPLAWGTIFAAMLGILLLGASIISIGVFISGMTESQVIAAVITFAVSIGITFLGFIISVVPDGIFKKIISQFSFINRFEVFAQGQINFSHMLFFVSVSALFLYYAAHTIERRKYVA